MVRRIVYRKNKVILKSDGLLSKDYTIMPEDDFQIFGKVYA